MAFRGSRLGTCSQRSLPSAATGLARWSLKARAFLGTALACGLAFVACQPPEDLWHLDAPLGALRTPPPDAVLRVTYKVSHGVRVAMASSEDVWKFVSYWDEEGTWALREPPKYLGLFPSAVGRGNTGDVYVLPGL